MTAAAKPKRSPKAPSADELRALRFMAEVEAAKRSLHSFVRQAWHVVEPDKPFIDNWHIGAICDHLEAVTSGDITDLLINVPPGTSKSYLVCVFWPCWEWAKAPGTRGMFWSYAESLAIRDAVRSRRLLQSVWYQDRWPLEFAEDVNQKGRFENYRGGWRIVASVGGKGIGEHPDRLVADDPHNILQAESDAERQSTIEWADGAMGIRGVIRNVRRVLIMQRLHAGDLSQHFLDQGGWVHLCLPMRYEPPERVQVGAEFVVKPRMERTPLGFQDPRTEDGALLWPAVYTEEKVQKMEVNLGLYHAAGQLQQRPTPRGGGMFKVAWFEVLQKAPPCVRYTRYWDKAGTVGGTGARSTGVLIGEYQDAAVPDRHPLKTKYVVLDVRTARLGAAEREALIKQTADLDAGTWGFVTNWVEQEPGSGGKESAEFTVANMAGHYVQADKVSRGKDLRAEPLASQASVGRIKLLAADWTRQALDELGVFPLGKLKDIVDSMAGAFNKMWAPTGAFTSAAGVHTGRVEESAVEVDRLNPGDF